MVNHMQNKLKMEGRKYRNAKGNTTWGYEGVLAIVIKGRTRSGESNGK